MEELFRKTCEPCKKGTNKLNNDEIEMLLRQVSGWSVMEVDSVQRLTKTFTFKNFKRAIEFANKIGVAAEQEGHHPLLLIEWGKVKVTWWTHKINGLDTNDFIMAAKSDALF